MKKRLGIGRGIVGLTLTAMVALAGCSAGSTKSPAATAGTGTGAPAQTAEPVLEFNWMNVPGMIQENSYGHKWMESKFNIKLKPVYPIASGDFAQKQQVQLAAGDVPDVMFVLDPGNLNKYASQGLLAEIPLDMIAKYAPRTKANLDKQAPQGWYYTNISGKNFGVPTFYFTGQFNTKQVWRTDLLKKAGIDQVPKTIDEITQAFAALKKIGVYGMSSNGQSYYNAFHSTFGAYGVMPTQWLAKDGKVVNGAVQPEAKEALGKLAEWYKAGYIDPDFLTGKDIVAKFSTGKIALIDFADAASLDESNPNSLINVVRKNDPSAAISYAPLPEGPRGQSGGWAWGTAGNIWAFGKQLEKDPAKMQKALQILDALQNDEQAWLPLAWGEKGKHWDYKDPAKEVAGGLKHVEPYIDNAKLQAEGIVDISTGTTFWGAQANLDIVGKYYNQFALDNYKLYNKPVWDLFGKSDILPSSGKYWGDLVKLKTETYARIIIGEQPLSSFDDFVKQWNERGGSQLEKEANETYSSMKR